MPGISDDRGKGNEAKWAHDEEMRFKVLTKRNRLLGHWAASELGLSGQEENEYAQAMVNVGMTDKGIDRVFQKIRDDFHGKKLGLSDQSIHAKFEELSKIALDGLSKGLS